MSRRALWDYTIRIFKGRRLLLETVHRGDASRDVELGVCRTRMARGEVSYVELVDHANGTTVTLYGDGEIHGAFLRGAGRGLPH